MRPPRLAPVALIAGVFAAVLGLAACDKAADPATAKSPPPGVAVTVADVVARDVPVQVNAIGNVQALSTVSVLSMLNGEVLKVHFAEGQEVASGAPLFTIDPRQLQAALLQAQATLAQHQAAVLQAQAILAKDTAEVENAKVDERRYKQLLAGDFVAREQYDQIVTKVRSLSATIDADKAAIETAKALVRADEAAVENVRVQLTYTEIRAPIGGRTGNLLMHQGNVVKANDVGNPLVVINQIHPIYVAFAVPEAQLDEIKHYYRTAGELPVEARPPGAPGTVARGKVTFINNTVDATTGTIQVKATFPNDDNTLWPGQFVNVSLILTRQPNAIVIPSQAVQSGQKGQYVFVVKADETVEARPVVPGAADGRDVVITSGLRAGERVVTDGQLRLVPGSRVDVKPAAPAAPSPAKAGG
ncbi:MAG TPA: efflux RND transporter periplasmic adaptor subunit [Verrucomicrobiae bacterium]|jgi:membrane fusion protein, multidrug efflux system|nr:efflux RND transporter periplasmic adaptor subunit [Verrucomicrobiae bacterium]